MRLIHLRLSCLACHQVRTAEFRWHEHSDPRQTVLRCPCGGEVRLEPLSATVTATLTPTADSGR